MNKNLQKSEARCGLNWGLCTSQGTWWWMRPREIHVLWRAQLRWSRELGSADHSCDTPAGFCTLQPKHSAATQQTLALFQGNKQTTKLCPFKPSNETHPGNPHSSLFLLCSAISVIFWRKKKIFFPKGKPLKFLHLQKYWFLPFLPSLPSDKPFSQESWSSLVPSSGMLFNTVGRVHPQGLWRMLVSHLQHQDGAD